MLNNLKWLCRTKNLFPTSIVVSAYCAQPDVLLSSPVPVCLQGNLTPVVIVLHSELHTDYFDY